jgi:hypothetical protein
MKLLSKRLWLIVAFVVGCAAAASAQAAPPSAATAAPSDDDVEITATAAPAAASTSPASAPAVATPAATSTATAGAASAAASASVAGFEQRAQALEQRNLELEARLHALELGQAASRKPQAAAATPSPGLRVSGYLQSQYDSSQISQDQLQPGGAPLNRDRFLVRRARLRFEQSWKYAGLDVELDSNTVRGVSFGIRRAAASLLLPGPSADAVPYAKLSFGLQDIGFGYELPFGSRGRIFMERSQASLAFFPGETDVGGTVSGGAGPIRYSLGVFNGQTTDGSTFAAIDPNAAKDLLLRVGVDLKPRQNVTFAGGVSFLTGTGFHAGSDATKNGIAWNDLNQDSIIQTATEVSAVPGTAATPSRNFKRWAAAADAQLGVHSSVGWSRLYGEVTVASNLDRGLFIADPYASSNSAGAATRELGYYLAFVQEVTPYGLVGFRTDFYDGDSDFVDRRRGQVVPANQSLRTYSPLVGLVLPEHARLVFQYDLIEDSLARDKRGVPTDLRNNQWTLRLQVGI